MIYTIVRRDPDNKVNAVISFDSVASVDESWSATVTNQTVEYGFNISDNINIEAPTYAIAATLSSYSLFNKDKEIVWDGKDFKASASSDNNSHIKARDEIIKVFSQRSLVTLIESSANSDNSNLDEKYKEIVSEYVREINNCVITALTINHPDQGTGSFSVTMSLQKIEMASIEISELAEGEKVALVRPLAVSFESLAKAKEKKDKGDIDPVTGLPVEDFSSAAGKGNREAMRKEWEERLGMPVSESYLDAVQRATYLTYKTKKGHSVIQQGTNYVVIKGFNANALMTVGGIVQDDR